ncbi:MAG: response regulator transcription factor [Chloroflexota bacterium]
MSTQSVQLPIRILVVDDHSIVRQGIRSLLSNYVAFDVIGEAPDGPTALSLIDELAPDVILLDIRMPGQSGLDILQQIRQRNLPIKVLILTSFDDDEYVTEALRRGAHGYVLKSVSDDSLVGAIHAVCKGERALSPQITEQVVRNLVDERNGRSERYASLIDEEIQILKLIANGASNTDLASRLFMSNATVKRKIRRIFDKLGVDSRTEAVATAIRLQLMEV